jgi:L-arabinose isomerase
MNTPLQIPNNNRKHKPQTSNLVTRKNWNARGGGIHTIGSISIKCNYSLAHKIMVKTTLFLKKKKKLDVGRLHKLHP